MLNNLKKTFYLPVMIVPVLLTHLIMANKPDPNILLLNISFMVCFFCILTFTVFSRFFYENTMEDVVSEIPPQQRFINTGIYIYIILGFFLLIIIFGINQNV